MGGEDVLMQAGAATLLVFLVVVALYEFGGW